MRLEISEYWKLADELSVHDASCLIIDVDPEETREYFEWVQDSDLVRCEFKRCPNGYIATRNAIMSALRSGLIDGHYHVESDINGNEWVEIQNSFVKVDSLKSWLQQKGFNHGFFFQNDVMLEDYLDKNNPFYSSKLAASIAVWKAISADPGRQNNGKSIKTNMINWLTSHAAEFDLIKDDGEINNNAIENQVAMVANWDKSGGSPKTPT